MTLFASSPSLGSAFSTLVAIHSNITTRSSNNPPTKLLPNTLHKHSHSHHRHHLNPDIIHDLSLDVGDGPSLQSAPPKPLVVPRHQRGGPENHHVRERVLLPRVRLRLCATVQKLHHVPRLLRDGRRGPVLILDPVVAEGGGMAMAPPGK